jgi:hypothetical protein
MFSKDGGRYLALSTNGLKNAAARIQHYVQ